MIRATTHTPDLGRTITFPADSIQHQLSLLTLVTHMSLSLPVVNTPHRSWNVVRYAKTHRQTINLILVTLTLKRYHHIWFTFNTTSTPKTPPDRLMPLSNMTPLPSPTTSEPPIHSLSRPTSQILLPPFLPNWPNKSICITTQSPTPTYIRPRPAKRYKDRPQ